MSVAGLDRKNPYPFTRANGKGRRLPGSLTGVFVRHQTGRENPSGLLPAGILLESVILSIQDAREGPSETICRMCRYRNRKDSL